MPKGYCDTSPRAFDEAARSGGATRHTVFLKIVLPLAKPIVIYTALMGFMGPFGDYMYASLIAFGNSKSYNVAVGMYSFLDREHIAAYFTRFCAGGVVIAVPIVLLFLWLQKYYVAGVTGGSVKG
jgi:arabinogalactan oligomer/maltooligosaccharide transport system permease protein